MNLIPYKEIFANKYHGIENIFTKYRDKSRISPSVIPLEK